MTERKRPVNLPRVTTELPQIEKNRGGRPRATTREEIARAAYELFSTNGYEQTTMGDIAASLGIAKRTLFRYFPSKNEIVGGDFDFHRVLDHFRELLEQSDPAEPIMQVVMRTTIAANSFEDERLNDLRLYMGMATTVPALQAHFAVRSTAWSDAITAFAARRLGQQPEDLVPLALGHAGMAATLAAFVRWVAHPEEELSELLRQAFAAIWPID